MEVTGDFNIRGRIKSFITATVEVRAAGSGRRATGRSRK